MDPAVGGPAGAHVDIGYAVQGPMLQRGLCSRSALAAGLPHPLISTGPGHDAGVSDAGIAIAVSKQSVRRHRWVPVLAAWLGVAWIELANLQNPSLLLFLIPPFELAVWLIAITLSVRLTYFARAETPCGGCHRGAPPDRRRLVHQLGPVPRI
ncbi:hypothetical protein OG799_18530 [Micromonospora sp. NBC_00898]|uniref:hypothetical protein n=1 Tax=Micromonospora sp. NBC_00898 TaxID=2975981 RepID=UPI003866AB68|nr:hypothetical protein OG799_18530 [Micromonospora sp. NBC_00898]